MAMSIWGLVMQRELVASEGLTQLAFEREAPGRAGVHLRRSCLCR
jgi:hypothetical protein